MKLIILLICLGFERYLRVGVLLQRFTWFESYLNLLFSRIPNENLKRSWLGVVTVMLPPLLILALIYWLIGDWVYGIVGLAISIAVLLYCLGPDDLHHQITTYFHACEIDDKDSQKSLLVTLLGTNPPRGKENTARALTSSIFIHANERFFGVIFWFIVLGPLGALLYRLAVLLRQLSEAKDSTFQDLSKEITWLQNLLDWLPARLSGLLFSLVGDFTLGFSRWVKYLTKGLSSSRDMLADVSMAAMTLDQSTSKGATLEENQNALNRVDRALVILLVVIAIFTLGAWIY